MLIASTLCACLQYLEWREKQYDVRRHVDIFSKDQPDMPAITGVLVYIATPNRATNHNYLGPASDEHIAQQIAVAYGPSGPNYEYLHRLADAMREVGGILASLAIIINMSCACWCRCKIEM